MRIAVIALVLAASGCVKAGFDPSNGFDPGDSSTPQPGDAAVVEAAADHLVLPPTTAFCGGTVDPTWTGVSHSNTEAVSGTVGLQPQPGFAIKKATLPTPRAWGAAARLKDQIFVFGGQTKPASYESTDQVLVYSVATDVSTVVAKLPTALLGTQAVTAGDGKIYLVMGIDPTVSATIESQVLRFDPVLKTLTVAGSGLYAAYYHGAALGANGLIYAFAGFGSGPLQSTIEGFDPMQSKVVPVSASLPSARDKLLAVAAPNGNIYLFGGALVHDEAGNLGGQITDQIFRFKPSPPSVELVTTRLPKPMINLAGGLLPDGQIYLVGGDTPSGTGVATTPVDTVLRFDPKTESLTKLADLLPEPLSGAAAVVGENGKLYLCGGFGKTGLGTKVLELRPFPTQGLVSGPVIDTASAGTRCLELDWSATLPPETTLEMRIRASEVPFDAGSQGWQPVVGKPPATTGLPTGRYLQWQATLRTTNSAFSPALAKVSLRYQTP